MDKLFIVYLITNKINQKRYVGITCYSLENRWRRHCYRAKHNSSEYFLRALRKYSVDNDYGINWEKLILESGLTKEQAAQKERYYIIQYKTKNKKHGYNLTNGGEGTVGYRHTNVSKAKMKNKALARGYKGNRNRNVGNYILYSVESTQIKKS